MANGGRSETGSATGHLDGNGMMVGESHTHSSNTNNE